MKAHLLTITLLVGASACAYPEDHQLSSEEIAESEALLRGAAWTPEAVTEIKNLARLVDPMNYRFQLPVFQRGQIVGTETIGRLPVTDVERVATYRGSTYVHEANAQSVIWMEFFQNHSGSPNGMAGCQSDHSTPAAGFDLGNRIRTVLQGIDQSEYYYLN